jgi:hypothetical protein
VSRVRENRTHGSTRRREATPDQSATAAPSPETSRRPYGAVAWVERNGLSLWLGESDSAGPRVVYASTSSVPRASARSGRTAASTISFARNLQASRREESRLPRGGSLRVPMEWTAIARKGGPFGVRGRL